tara:strand:- start:278 stop:709 length:432 start_codon:yes stop_codon:yes gene_type:complete
MILFDLICKHSHRFEAWFPSSEQYDKQRKRGLVKCPYCNTTSVKKAIMAPNVQVSKISKVQPESILQKNKDIETTKEIKKIKKYIEMNTENVGTRFAEEARKIYYGEKKARPIRGEATQNETKQLEEEGVPYTRLPWASKEDA